MNRYRALNNKYNHLQNDSLQDRTILVVNTGSLKKKFILQKLKKLGLKLILLNKEKNWAQPYVDHWIIANTDNHVESLQCVDSFITANPDVKIEGVVTFWEDDVLLASRIADKYNFIGIPYSIAKKARNKYLFREFCIQNKIRAPQHTLVRSMKDINYVCNRFDFPLVIKPVYGSSSAYVVKIENKDELINTYNYIRKNMSTNTESALTDGMDILVEEYIDGDEVDIDILLQHGKVKFYSISDNYQTNEPFFMETGQAIPTSLPISSQKALVEMAEETLEKLGIQNGCIHFEAKSTRKGPVPIEVNLRMGGDYVYSYIKGAWNIDLIEYAVKIAFGMYIKIKKPELPRKYIIGKDFLADNSGILVKLDFDETVKKREYVEELHFYKKTGDPVFVPPEGYETLGWVTVSGDNNLDVQANMQDVLRYVQYDVAKFDSESSLGKTSRKNRFSSAVLNKNLLMRAAKIEHIRRVSKRNQRNLHIGVAYNMFEDSHDVVERELMSIGVSMEETLRERGYRVTTYDFNDFTKVTNDLKQSDVDLVFNVCERNDNSTILKSHVASLLDSFQIPYTGSNALTLALAADKIQFKKVLAYHSIPTPKWDYAYEIDDEINTDLKFPLIVKPGNTDNSFGITNESVVTNQSELQRQLRLVIVEMGRPALVEEYVEGDEYDVSILGSEEDDYRILPLSRSIFKQMPEGYWHIYPYGAKWSNDPVYDNVIVQRPPKNIGKKLEALISEIALDTYAIMDCLDYGRVEIRVDKDNNPYVLELNPNPPINRGGYLANAAKLVDMNYGDLLEEIITMAISRYKKKTYVYNSFANLTPTV